MRKWARSTAGLVLMMAGTTGAAWAPAPFKCGRAINEANPVVYLVNGSVVPADPMPSIDRTSVVAVHVVCSHAGHRVFGVGAGRDLVHVVTRDADWSALLRASMQSIAIGQEEHLARTGGFAAELDQLLWVQPGRPVDVELRVTDGGRRWSATGGYRDGGDRVAVAGERSAPVADPR